METNAPRSEERCSGVLRTCKSCCLENLNSSYFYKTYKTVCRSCLIKGQIQRYARQKEAGRLLQEVCQMTTCKYCKKEKTMKEFYVQDLGTKMRCKECNKQAINERNMKKQYIEESTGVKLTRKSHKFCICCHDMKPTNNFMKLVLCQTARHDGELILKKNKQYQGMLSGIMRRCCVGCLEAMMLPLLKNEYLER